VTPSGAEVLVDIRTIPGQSHKTLKSRLTELVGAVEGEVKHDLASGWEKSVREELHSGLSRGMSFSAAIDIFEDRPWTQTDRTEPIVESVTKAYRLVTGKEPVYNGVPGATDGTFLHAWAGIPIVTTGAGDRMVPHQKDEWVDIHQLVETARVFAASILGYLDQ
jgi:succinyl-diaminopimelate desuccinylase